MTTSKKPVTPIVEAIGQMKLHGNIIPHSWYQEPVFRYPKGGININAMLILSDLLYWYTPTVIRDEETGQILRVDRKFSGDMAQKSYKAWSEMFGLSKGQVTDAVSFLVQANLIRREFRDVPSQFGVLRNVMFVEPIPDAIADVSLPKPGRIPVEGDTSPDGTGHATPPNRTRHPAERGTVTETPTETPSENPAEIPHIPDAASAKGVSGSGAGFGNASLFGEEKIAGTSRKVEEKPKTTDTPRSSSPTAVDKFAAGWAARYGMMPRLAKHECIQLANLSKELPGDFDAVLAAFLADDDAWVVGKCHAVSVLQGRLNAYILKARGLAPTPPAPANRKSDTGAGRMGVSGDGIINHATLAQDAAKNQSRAVTAFYEARRQSAA